MPALYSDIETFKATSLGRGLAAFLPDDFTLCRRLSSASEQADRITARRLGMPAATTLTAAASSGDMKIVVAATANLQLGDALVFPDGQEAEAQGIVVDPWEEPLPGTIRLTMPLVRSYGSGAAVVPYRQERYPVRGKSTNPIDREIPMNQAAQIAAAHAPKLGIGVSSRIIRTREYPLWSVRKAYRVDPWGDAGTEIDVDLAALEIEREQGWFRFNMGIFNLVGSIWRIQYVAGFDPVGPDIEEATHLLLAADLARAMNPIGAHEVRSEGQMLRMSRPNQAQGAPPPHSYHVEEAHRILETYKRRGV